MAKYSFCKLCISIHGGSSRYPYGLQPLDCWDRGYESFRGHSSSSVVFVVYYARSGLCNELITRSEESYRLCV